MRLETLDDIRGRTGATVFLPAPYAKRTLPAQYRTSNAHPFSLLTLPHHIMAASSGHLTPAGAAPPGSTRPSSTGSARSLSRRSPVPTIASSIGNFPLAAPSASGSEHNVHRQSKMQSGRSTPTGYILRGSRHPSPRDPNAHLDELNQVPERPAIVPAEPVMATPASEEQEVAVQQALKKGSKLFHKGKRRQISSFSDADCEALGYPVTSTGELERAEQATQRAKKQLAERQGLVIDVYDGDEDITTPDQEAQRSQKPVYVWEGELSGTNARTLTPFSHVREPAWHQSLRQEMVLIEFAPAHRSHSLHAPNGATGGLHYLLPGEQEAIEARQRWSPKAP